MNSSGSMLMERLPSARRAGGVGVEGSGALVVGLSGSGRSQQHTTYSTKNSLQSNDGPLPVLRHPVNSEWRGMSPLQYSNLPPGGDEQPILSGQKNYLHSGDAQHSTPPHLMGKNSNSNSNRKPPMTTPHLPPPGARGSSAGPRPVPPHVQSRGPAPPVSPNTAHGMSRPVNWSAMSGNPGPGNWNQASSQVQQGQHVMPVARGPQPNSVEPTRLRNGKKIRDVERRQQQIAEAPHEHQTFSGPTKSAVLRRKEQLQLQQRDANSGKHIKTTVGNDNSWVKGLAYSTWVDSPKGTLNHLDREGPYKRQPKGNRNLRKNKRTASRNSMGKSSLLVEALRNLFR